MGVVRAARAQPASLQSEATVAIKGVEIGQVFKFSKTVGETDVTLFAGLTGDFSDTHINEQYMQEKSSIGTRIAHGLYTASLISAVLGTRLPGPGAVYISQTLNFRAPVKIGDTVDVNVTVAELIPEKHRARLGCHCTVEGEVVLDGEALVKVPSRDSGGRPPPRV